MSYIPNTDQDVREMLSCIGRENADELFSHIPDRFRFKGELELPEPFSEMELISKMRQLSQMNSSLRDTSSFLGGGVYHHYIPSVVGHLIERAEFSTSYTPYQPEISQGTLQAIFEYQTLMCLLTGMDVSNASMYDGASSTAEAVLMALRSNRSSRIALSSTLHPEYRRVIETYARANDKEVFLIPYSADGSTDTGLLSERIDEQVSCVVLQSPNFFGIVEELRNAEKIAHSKGALLIVVFTEPIAYGLLKPPGIYGADIVCGEGQSMGIPPGFGGPLLGILACRQELLRALPGRIVGKTHDMKGNGSYVLTLTAREQHIRREKSTSNICTNHGLCALAAAVFLTSYGKKGFRSLAAINHGRAEYAKSALSKLAGVKLRFSSPTFNEFVIETEKDPNKIASRLLDEKILFGIRLKKDYPELERCTLMSCTEMNSEQEIERLCTRLKEIGCKSRIKK